MNISTLDIVFGSIGVIILFAGWYIYGKWKIACTNAAYEKRMLENKVYADQAARRASSKFEWSNE